MKLMKNRVKYVIIPLVVVGFLFGIYFQRKSILIISDRSNDKEYTFVLPNNKFSLGYTHSVMKTDAMENFVVEKNKMKLISTIYQSYGVGLPFLPEEGQLEIIDGKFVLKTNRTFETINMTISPLGNHYLKIEETTYRFEDIVGKETVKILVRVSKKN